MAVLEFQKPQPKQLEFMKAKTLFVAYGGAKGGGKSWALRNKLVRMCLKHGANNDPEKGAVHPGISCLIVRRSFPEVYENQIQFIEQDLEPLLKSKGSIKVVHNHQDHYFLFPNGSRLKYGYCANERDLDQFQGQSYDVVAIDEATQFLEKAFNTLAATVRGNPSLPKRVYLTMNPGGVGHNWCKRLFIDKDFKRSDNPDEDENPEDYTFIAAKYTDNKFNGAQYVKMLNAYPEELRKAYMFGDWTTFIGQYFPEWNEKSLEADRFSKIPDNWIITMSIDYGLDCFAAIWYATNENGITYILKGIEVKNTIVSAAADKIYEIEKDLELSNRRIRRLAPPDLWNRAGQTGRSTIDLFSENGLIFMRSDNNREAGWMAIKEMLQDHGLLIFRGAAPELNKCMALLQYDENKLNDVAKEPHDITHSPDALRYFAIMRQHRAKGVKVVPRENYFTHDIEPKKARAKRVHINPKVFRGGWNG